MSVKANRRRARAPVNVKLAFGNDDEDDSDEKLNNQYTPDVKLSPFSNQNFENINGDIHLDRSYQQAFFTIHNITVEIILENDILTWKTVKGDSNNEASRQKFATQEESNSINLQDIFAITALNTHWNWSLNVNQTVAGTTVSTVDTYSLSSVPSSTLSQASVLRGFQLHSYQTMEDNILREILIIFQSDDAHQCERWYKFLSKIIDEYRTPRHIFVICNPYAGLKTSRHTYNQKIKSLLPEPKYKITYKEIEDQCSADEVLEDCKNDFDSIDSLVIIGGDGSVINVINALIRYLAKQNRIKLDTENDLPSIPFPLCIIPEGTTNIISHTIHGNTDHCTPLLHLILNKRMHIDMSAIYDNNYNFITANFSAGAGYPANILKYFPKYRLHRPKTIIKKSFGRAASSKNLKPIEMLIRYIPATQNDVSIRRCYRGCPSCTPEAPEKSDNRVTLYDNSHIQKSSRRKKSATSNNEHNNRILSAGKISQQYNENEKNWKMLNQDYLQIAILTNANLWSFAPQGIAKYGHIADGLLDLILIAPVTRKEFLRYIKRNGNSKDQFEFAFTKLIKVKEIEIELKLSNDEYINDIINTDNQLDSSPSDDSSNEDMSDNENKSSGLQKHQPHPPSAPISDDIRLNRQRRRRIKQESSPPILQQSISVDTPRKHSKSRPPQSESELDNTQIDPYGSTTSLRRSGIFPSFRSKKEGINLPRTSSARGRETDEEKQIKKNRRSAGGTTLRPARSLLNILSGGNSSIDKTDKGSTLSRRDSFSNGIVRRPSVISRASSMVDNTKSSTRKKKQPCMWNLDFSPYNSPIIRIKCLYRYLTVYGVGIDPDTKIKEVNYSCFGRI